MEPFGDPLAVLWSDALEDEDYIYKKNLRACPQINDVVIIKGTRYIVVCFTSAGCHLEEDRRKRKNDNEDKKKKESAEKGTPEQAEESGSAGKVASRSRRSQDC